MVKVLVTGASGFVGSHLAKRLAARGEEVTCLVRKRSVLDRLRPLGVRLVYGDVTDKESLATAVSGKQTVYQVAGITRALHTEEFFRVNQQGVRNVACTCAEQPTPPVLVCVSSLAAAGPALDGRLRTESDPPVQVSNYGRSKRAGERAAEEFADRAAITIVRPAIVLGEADTAGLDLFKTISRFGVHPVPGLGQHRYSLIHAEDLANLLILAARRGTRLPSGHANGSSSSRGYYFAACDVHPTYADLGRMIAAALGRQRVLILPTLPRAIWGLAAATEAIARIRRQPGFLNFDKAREVRAGSWLCSPKAAGDELGFSITVPLADRLSRTVQWYRDAGWL